MWLHFWRFIILIYSPVRVWIWKLIEILSFRQRGNALRIPVKKFSRVYWTDEDDKHEKISSKKMFVFALFDVGIFNFCCRLYLCRMAKYSYYIDLL